MSTKVKSAASTDGDISHCGFMGHVACCKEPPLSGSVHAASKVLLKSSVADADAGERIAVGAGAGGEEGAEEGANAGADTANGDGAANCCSEDLPELLGEASFVPLFD